MKKGNYKELFDGIKQCQDCGFSVAEGENKLHSICHNNYLKSKDVYGSHVLSFAVLVEMESKVEAIKREGGLLDCNSMISKVISKQIEGVLTEIDELNKKTDEKIENKKKDIYDKIEVANKVIKGGSEQITEITELMIKEIEKIDTMRNKKIRDIRLKNGLFIDEINPEFLVYDYLLDLIFTVEFTKSLKFWDFFRPHPIFEDYVVILWNTPSFIKYLEKFIPIDILELKIKENKSNRRMRDTDMFFEEFVFLKAVVANEGENQSTLKDLSHIDNIMFEEDEEVDDLVTDEEEPDIATEKIKDIFTSLVKGGRKGVFKCVN